MGCGCAAAASFVSKSDKSSQSEVSVTAASAITSRQQQRQPQRHVVAARVDEKGFADAQTQDSDTLVVDPNSRLVHPRTVTVNEKHTLVAAGTRMVTFLRYYVYSAAIYLPTDHAARIRSMARVAAAAQLPHDQTEERAAVVASIQDIHMPKVIRVAPYRKAAFSHLRDGFGRALDARARAIVKDAPEKQAQLQEEISTFKQLFPRGDLQLGEELLMVFRGDRVTLQHQGRDLGSMHSTFVGSALIEAYLGKDSVNPALRGDFWNRSQQ
ncbi:hypothetical protein PTSG_01740 [Salpingoeca rosetta]|uniref:Chalcone isomerase domain-containing protein n=1 Tax=Salpingoeca rosetta (strain ATCC 50818 / BSB-021) TaxID=946362 RepID=F2TYT9_SALR5|nr:uncharacterized protein PTSG_01740 [Salpingoeca rosetta]EGD78763.1 hypothetical protein PTSG_01740 [Salpingoeca rosetta]|eukprot:XP_004997719.1 hypothetical protein PTSG_01740 [Salpingoeca rosetta]